MDEKETQFNAENQHEKIRFLFATPDTPVEEVPFMLRVGVWWRGSEVGEFVENCQQIVLDPGVGLPGVV